MNKIKAFLNKFWWALICIGAFILAIIFKKSDNLDKKIKEQKEKVINAEKELKKSKMDLKDQESDLKKANEEAKEKVEELKTAKADRDKTASGFFPDL